MQVCVSFVFCLYCMLCRFKTMATVGSNQTNRKKFKGHGWSQKGTKASRREARELARKPRFYAVAKGYRPGIYRVWSNAAKQVVGYKGNVHKSFGTLREAYKFMRRWREYPPGIKTPFPPAPDTPLPPQEYVYPPPPSDSDTTDDESSDFHDEEVVQPRIQVAPPMKYVAFKEVKAVAQRIADDPGNRVLDGSICPCGNCPYSREGTLMEQRFLLMRRLFQLNAQLPFTNTSNS